MLNAHRYPVQGVLSQILELGRARSEHACRTRTSLGFRIYMGNITCSFTCLPSHWPAISRAHKSISWFLVVSDAVDLVFFWVCLWRVCVCVAAWLTPFAIARAHWCEGFREVVFLVLSSWLGTYELTSYIARQNVYVLAGKGRKDMTLAERYDVWKVPERYK